jgi:hypothetical protein
MKSILSPYDDTNFNNYLLQYVKKRLAKKCRVFTKDDEERKYFLDKDSRDYYTPDDVIKSIELVNGRVIRFGNQKLINYIVYDLSQRFWYDELKHINNSIHALYLRFKRFSEEFAIQQRKLSREKKAPNRVQGTRP